MKRIHRRIGILGLGLALALGGPPAARAADTPCPDGRPQVPDLGIQSLECDCTVRSTDGQVSYWRFRSEPMIRGLRPERAAAAVLREGDVIEAIDGVLITTREGGRRFAGIQTGVPVRLSVRRGDVDLSVRLVPEAVCAGEALGSLSPLAPLWAPETPPTPAPPTAVAPPEAPAPRAAPRPPEFHWVTPRTPAPAAPGLVPYVFDVSPRGWLGVGLNCQECGGERSGRDGPVVWKFGSLPEVYNVEPESPAARAGIRRGDVLTHIDGISLLTPEGGRRFGGLKPGQAVKWTIRRGATIRQVAMVAGSRPEPQMIELEGMLDRMREQMSERKLNAEELKSRSEQLQSELRRLREIQQNRERRLRFAGSVGGSDVEVRGLDNVVVVDEGDGIVITTPDARIVIRPSEKASPVRRAVKATRVTPAPKPETPKPEER